MTLLLIAAHVISLIHFRFFSGRLSEEESASGSEAKVNLFFCHFWFVSSLLRNSSRMNEKGGQDSFGFIG